MFNDSLYSSAPSPIITYISTSRFDERGRQLQFVESEVQRQQRLAIVKSSAARKNWQSFDSPCSSPSSSASGSLSNSPLNSPYSSMIDISSLSSDPYSLYSTAGAESSPKRTTHPSNGKRGHSRRSSIALNIIPEED
ncbi:hypothetical protein FA15DRAFT_387355 [Coprinopsis marcescibilis]|uniref:Uncharacterized protein n=1 Tax=Coprinopsis marcescibilis TaxID=230819 RepID=A0A5C3KWV4_COPMA|nr:hypothetical protein FA15DRAFT_387355 [Coprinopsis marcescibilis]